MLKPLRCSASQRRGKLKQGSSDNFNEFRKIRSSEDTKSLRKPNCREPRINSSKRGSIGQKNKENMRFLSKQKGDLGSSERKRLKLRKESLKSNKGKDLKSWQHQEGQSSTDRSKSKRKPSAKTLTFWSSREINKS